MALARQRLGEVPRTQTGPAQRGLRVAPGRGFDQGLQRLEQGRVVMLHQVTTSAKGTNTIGGKVILWPLDPLTKFTHASPNRRARQTGSFSDQRDATTTQGPRFTS